MEKVYQEVSQQSGKKLHILGYFVADLVGLGAGIGVGSLVHSLLGNTLLTVILGMAAALLVAGGIMALVCYMAGTWDEEAAPYLAAPVQEEVLAQSAGGEKNVRGSLKTNRGLVKYILLSLITLGIYGIYGMWAVGNDINVIARKYDGKKTMNYCLVYFLLSGVTLGIASLVWYHKVSARIGRELDRRGIGYHFGAGSFWGWNILGLFIGIGPFIYMHKLFKALNLLSKDYNVNF